jgi:FMN-dependent NADH-azoreductase
MYNVSVPSQLKAWIDRIAIAGKTFQYGPNGPEGLVKNKRVIIALAKGGFYGEGAPAASLEHLETYLKGVFNFIGVEPEFVLAEGLGVSPEHREQSLAQAVGETLKLAA